MFTGGAVVPLFLDQPELVMIRPTKDVDVVIQAASILAYQEIESHLQLAGWRHDTSRNAPRCRWIHQNVLVDILSSSPVPGEFSSPWFDLGIQKAWSFPADGQNVPVVPATVFLASKLDAFWDRGHRDPWASHDLEDVITVVDGRESLVDEVKNEDTSLRSALAQSFTRLHAAFDLNHLLPGFLPSDPGSQQRLPKLTRKLQILCSL
ncbi:MAG: hypothetical protein JJU05_17350 [Verrucomicrobia bacterium]|nr:hypothetical protein [Verrucomicrobiota bacterium]MCH8529029.1 hypothetical protein [Kiritimatiellia bacterium]